jgi:hypothetical protein
MIGFTDTLYTQHVTSINYSAITISTLYSSMLHIIRSSVFTSHILAMDSNTAVIPVSHIKSSLHSPVPSLQLFSITFDCRLSQFSF